MTKCKPLLFLAAAHAFFLLTAPILPGQVSVTVSLKRSTYLKYEPVIATVTIQNQTGRELQLLDSDGKNWFGFEISSLDNRPIPPRNAEYQLDPVQLGPGQRLTRDWNLTPLYMMGEDGSYHVRAHVYLAEANRYYSSNQEIIEITEGRTIWQQTVGVPGDNGGSEAIRTVSLISLRLSRSTMLYLRIEDKENGVIYATHKLGKIVNYGTPAIEFDVKNTIHVLQNSAPKAFTYTKVDLDGKILERKFYQQSRTQPTLTRKGGAIAVTGGELQTDQNAANGAPPSNLPSISDRPVPLPQD